MRNTQSDTANTDIRNFGISETVYTTYRFSPFNFSHSNPSESSEDDILLFGPLGNGWTMKEPLIVTVEYSDGEFIISEDIFGIYGLGNTKADAFRDYISSLIEYYELISLRSTDNPASRNLFFQLQKHLSRLH